MAERLGHFSDTNIDLFVEDGSLVPHTVISFIHFVHVHLLV